MESLAYRDGEYRSPEARPGVLARLLPSWALYRRFGPIVFRASRKAKRGRYDDGAWQASSMEVLRLLERLGVRFEITGVQHVQEVQGSCVLIANHMSTMETVVLPAMVRPFRPVTFIVKQSLLETRVFRHVMRSRDPVAVTRSNPRQDLKAVLAGGVERLGRGISIIVFPQTTRTVAFEPEQFSSIGVKLAQRAGVPVVPVALDSSAWENGRWVKDVGRLVPSRPARFTFGEPLRVQGRGAEEHQAVIDFIEGKLAEWAAAGEVEPGGAAAEAAPGAAEASQSGEEE